MSETWQKPFQPEIRLDILQDSFSLLPDPETPRLPISSNDGSQLTNITFQHGDLKFTLSLK